LARPVCTGTGGTINHTEEANLNTGKSARHILNNHDEITPPVRFSF
jgi:hypothetical protein